MSYQSRLVDDEDFFRETRRWQRDEDAADREQVEEARRERDRHVQPETRLPLVVRRP